MRERGEGDDLQTAAAVAVGLALLAVTASLIVGEHAAGVVVALMLSGCLVERIELGGHPAAAATAARRERWSGHPPAEGTG